MFVCAGNNETFPFATPIGVGLIESAMHLTRMALFDKPEFLIFIGSAGSYGKYKPFDIVETSVASNIELAFLENRAYTPLDNVIEAYQKDSDVSRETKDIVNCSNYISTDFSLVQSFRKYKIELENMEFFSVLKISQEFSIPVLGIFVVTNYCNEAAHEDFIKHHEEAKQQLMAYVVNKYKALKK
ncbi:MAG TPA: purine-nucleoside phosphorylase [Campylobacteraceae bacterium]|nr:purine-nucleoside phosphorylase [Campylobacteraceae bacterium]